MELKTKDGMRVVSDVEWESIEKLRILFKRHRDTVAVIFQFSKEGKPVTNLMSKMWRIADDIMDEMRKFGGVQ